MLNKIILSILLTCLIEPAMAELQSHPGKVTGYIASELQGNKLFYFKLENTPSSSCNTTQRFAIDGSRPMYESAYSAVLASFHSQTSVRVYYDGSCDTAGNALDILWICVGDIAC